MLYSLDTVSFFLKYSVLPIDLENVILLFKRIALFAIDNEYYFVVHNKK